MADTTLTNPKANGKRELDDYLAYNIILPLMYHAEILSDTSMLIAEGTMLHVLGRDIERRIAQVFAQINAQHPGIIVEVPPDDEDTARFYIR